ncbi:hypothetical protein CROQUDRAFT_91590 [Cronartium quercuum f. sp. fusiforme G11]|uniref:Uncharacterized protein n=1 Tax=Cronartium quercuum f. sp. fusiforme G11 TaxID=708437 RepID=A0A9P6TD47_9BASI|nr:hypothetical protein CROQUDRAFT_91590 [Cronartium quercuum f. sp. fusiforme G11]
MPQSCQTSARDTPMWPAPVHNNWLSTEIVNEPALLLNPISSLLASRWIDPTLHQAWYALPALAERNHEHDAQPSDVGVNHCWIPFRLGFAHTHGFSHHTLRGHEDEKVSLGARTFQKVQSRFLLHHGGTFLFSMRPEQLGKLTRFSLVSLVSGPIGKLPSNVDEGREPWAGRNKTYRPTAYSDMLVVLCAQLLSNSPCLASSRRRALTAQGWHILKVAT